jgi:hypothetical protein
MVLAQALGEYAAVSALSEAIVALGIRIQDAVFSLEPAHYAIGLLAAAIAWRIMLARS